MLGTWPCPAKDCQTTDELVVSFEKGRETRVLVLPALFEEANKLRRFTVGVMRLLDDAGIDTFLPDWPGCNESLKLLHDQSLAGWRESAQAAQNHFSATHILAIRGGALLDPGTLPGTRYAPVEGASILRNMLRARVLTDREAGVSSDREALLEQGKAEGMSLAGYTLSAAMISQLQEAVPIRSNATGLAQSAIGGSGLWLRSEPTHDQQQAEKLAALLVAGMR